MSGQNTFSVLLQFENANSAINLNSGSFPHGSSNGAFFNNADNTYYTTITLTPGPGITTGFPHQFYVAIQRTHWYNQRLANAHEQFTLHSRARVRTNGGRCIAWGCCHGRCGNCCERQYRQGYKTLNAGTYTCAPPDVNLGLDRYTWYCTTRVNRPTYRIVTLIDNRLNVTYSNPVTLF